MDLKISGPLFPELFYEDTWLLKFFTPLHKPRPLPNKKKYTKKHFDTVKSSKSDLIFNRF